MCLTGGRSEAKLVYDITRTILKEFIRKHLHVDKNLIGMDDHLNKIIPQMINLSSNKVRMIGIY